MSLVNTDDLFETKKKSRYKLKLIIMTICFFALLFAISYINVHFTSFDIFGKKLDAPGVNGIFTVIMSIICICMVNVDYKAGFRVSAIVLILPVISISASIIRSGTLSALPGFTMVIEAYIIVILEYIQLKQIKKNESRLIRQAVVDSLTGLPNRHALNVFVDKKIARNEPFFLLFLDIDNFKRINDSLGHKYGDIVLCEVARRWSELIDKNSLIARSGGDEFNIVFAGTKEENMIFMQKCINVLNEKIDVGSYKQYATVSIGASQFPDNGTDFDSLFRHADTAMYNAKRNGKNQLCIFSDEMSDNIRYEVDIERIIREAMENNYFYLVFQPQFTTNGHNLRGFEALLRLRMPEGRVINPEAFIPIAEKCALILDIDRLVLKKAISFFAPVLREYNNSFSISVNISSQHFADAGFTDEIVTLLNEYEYPPHCLEIEITEYCLIGSMEQTMKTMNQLKEIGVMIALDDFGTGYASLSNLVKLPVDLLKIDKSFIDNIEENKCGGDFVRSIVSIGHLINCDVIAEGIETAEQLKALEEYNCEYIQGFYWGRPVEMDKAIEIIKTEQK